MKIASKVGGIAAAVALLTMSSPAWAGTAVYGHGNDMSAAMAQADSRAQAEAQRRRTCISEYSAPNRCVRNNGMWTCHAIVANHMGSCRR